MTEKALSIRLLGPVEAELEGRPLSLRRGREQALLAALAIDPGSLRSREFLISSLWPGRRPENPANALQGVVARVRRADPRLRLAIEEHDGGYRLAVPRESVDAARLEDAVRSARDLAARGEWRPLRDRLEGALAARRGEPLAGADGILGVEAARLDDLDAEAHALLADARLALGEGDGLAAELADATRRHPLHEPLWERRLRALAAAGRRPEALIAYEDLRTKLRDELGIGVGERLRQIHSDLVTAEIEERPRLAAVEPPAPTAALGAPAPLTSLIGRARELDTLRAELEAGARLLTIVGPGGVGKTRLALEWSSGDPGARFVALDGMDPSEDVLAGIAATLNVPEDPTRDLARLLAEALPGQPTLVLDGAERVRESAASAVDELLGAGAHLRILVTSRNAIGLPGERLLRLAPLGSEVVPASRSTLPDAARLVLDRARSADPGIDAGSPAARSAAAEIGARLDGLPLAIELAAARASVLSLPQLAASLDANLGLLEADEPGRPRRHRTLSGTVAWSLELLAPADRRLFAIAGMFASVFDADAVATLGGGAPASMLAGLVRLAEHSLIEPAPHDGDARGPCFRMLAPIRAHARRRLADLDEEGAVRARYEELVADLAEHGDVALRGPEQHRWLARLDRLRGDFEQVLAGSIAAGRLDTASRVTAALGRYWDWRGRLRDAIRWTQAVLDAVEAGERSPPRLGATTSWRGWFASEVGEHELALRLAAEGERLSREVGDTDGEFTGIGALATMRRAQGAPGEAVAAAEQILPAAERAGDRWAMAWSLNSRGYARAQCGEIEGAEADARRSGEMFAELGDHRAANWARLLSAIAALRQGDRERAADLSEHARAMAAELGDERTAAAALEVLAEAAPSRSSSAELLAAAQALRERRGQAAPAFPDAGGTR